MSHAASTTLRPSTRAPIGRLWIAALIVLVLCLILSPASLVHASAVFWLPTEQASDASFDHLNPALASYHNHAFALSVRVNGSSQTTSVFLTTNESGHWATQLVTNQGPRNTYFSEFVSLAVDAGSGRLYAVWAYQKGADLDAIGVWTRDAAGSWSGPVDVATAGSLLGQPSIVAGNGKAYVAFIGETPAGSCNDSAFRLADVQTSSFDGNAWSAPQNLTSCVANSNVTEFINPRLALDEAGRVSLISFANGDLWYSENAGSDWTTPAQITNGAAIPDSVGTALRTFDAIAGSGGTAYVAYTRTIGTSATDVLLIVHPAGGSWSAPLLVSPADPANCPKFGLSIVASAGRIAIAYVRGHTGYCQKSSGIFSNVPFLFAGTPGSMAAVSSLEGAAPDCFYTTLANEGALFRLVTSCDHPTTLGKGQLYFKAEFLDSVGPIAHLLRPILAGKSIQLRWSAKDPQPGSGVASYTLQVRVDTGSRQTLLKSSTAKSFTYRPVRSGHRYAFRLRARDHAGNWGAWVSANIQVR